MFDKPSVQLQHVCLQRCFQLTHSTLVHGLQRARLENSSIRTLTFSHLDLRAPSQVASPPHARSLGSSVHATTSSLETLALHCCEGLSPAFFCSLASLAPNLKALLLGGSTVSSRACMQSYTSYNESFNTYTAQSDVASSPADSEISSTADADKPKVKRWDTALMETDLLPRFDNVLALVCRVREDMLSRAMADTPFPAAKEQPTSYVVGSPPKCVPISSIAIRSHCQSFSQFPKNSPSALNTSVIPTAVFVVSAVKHLG